MRTTRSWLVFSSVGLALAVLTVRLGLGEEPAASESDARVVAIVNGDAITYHDIKLSVESFSRFELEKKRTPQTAADLEEARRTRHASEAKQLKAHIVVAIRRQVQKEQQVVVSEEEVSAHIQELIDNPDPSSTPEAIRAKYVPLLAALEAVYEHSEEPDDVYEHTLADRMPREMWELNLQYYKTPERRRLLAKRIEEPELIISDSLRDGVRRALVTLKTREAVQQVLETTDPEVAEYVRLARTDPTHEKVKSKPYNYLEIKRYQWWQERFREADVEIKDKRFRDVWKEPFE